MSIGGSLRAAIIGLTVIGPTWAADVVPADDALQEVIVTARRTEERLQDVPISIQVFNQQQLDALNVVDAQDLAVNTPSLSVNTLFGSQNTTFAIRGFVQDIGEAPSVGNYFADVVTPRAPTNGVTAGDGFAPGSFFDLQNVQILKGPQGTLFGRNTTGGDILLVPQKPTDQLGGYVEGSYGNYAMTRGQAVLNVPINDSVRARFGVDHQSRNGYVNNRSGIGPTDYDDVNYTALRASVVVDILPNLENYSIASYNRSDTNGSVQKLVAAGGGQLSFFSVPQIARQSGFGFYDVLTNTPADPYSNLSQWQIINTTTWRSSDTLTIKNIASYAQLKDSLNQPVFGTDFSVGQILGPSHDSQTFGFAQISPLPGHDLASESTITEELQFQGRTSNDRLTWQAGGYLEYALPLGISGSQSPIFLPCTNSNALQCEDIIGELAGAPTGNISVIYGENSRTDKALYAQSTYEIGSQVKVTGGLRYTWDDATNDSTQQNVLFLAPGSLPTDPQPIAGTVPSFVCTLPQISDAQCHRHTSESSSAPTWLIDVDYTPTPDVLAYAKYARGYRAGAINPNIQPPFTTVSPETVDAYEVGAKTAFHKVVNGIFDVAAFYNDFRDQQIQLAFDPGINPATGKPYPVTPTEAPVNAGRSRIYGFEVETSIAPFKGFTLDGNYTYLNTRILEIKTFTLPPDSLFVPVGQLAPGDELAFAPHNKYSLTGTYALPVSDRVGTISLGVTFVHTDSSLANYGTVPYAEANNLPQYLGLGRLRATNLLDLDLTWRGIFGTPLDLSIFATNVTGDQYYTYIPDLAMNGAATAQLGEPTLYGARLRVRFGT
jgi:iron complex outermembrane receptor protein